MQHVRRGLPPTLILNGKADRTTSYSIEQRYCRAAEAMGGDCRVTGHEGADHRFFNRYVEGGRWYRPKLLEVDRFLTRIGYQ